MKSTPSEHYSRSFSGFVWKIKVDHANDKIWLEVRDEANYEVSLFYVLVEEGLGDQYLPENPIDWWDNLSHVYSDYLVLQKITDTKNPGPSDLIIIDFESKKELFKLSQVYIDSIDRGTIFYKSKGDTYETSQYHFNNSSNSVVEKIQNTPSIYPEEHAHHAIVSRFLQHREIFIVGPVAYLEQEEHIFIAYHRKANEHMTRHLLWIKNGKEWLHEIIDQEMKGYSHESFFTFGNYLIFIKNRKSLFIHQLNNEID